MIIFITVVLLILTSILFIMSYTNDNDALFIVAVFCSGIFVVMLIFSSFHGFINYPKTEGTHQGVITAVDLEGVYFRRYEVYLKSSGYTNQSDETMYLIYDYETDLAKELQELIGSTVQLHYGHDGGYIPWNSCGTYHIKSVEKVEK